ncbi:MAG: hypothetical protein FJ125_14170 [Deltaproteobacteria bacterium]|nr:hypothetical protein [Deltaproteobacteria bacterium]
MSPSDTVRARLSRLLAEAATELEALERIHSELAQYAPQLGSAAVGRPILALVAVDLHDYYTALETVFERVARLLDGDMPVGPDWHRELVEQMAAELPPLRAPVIGPGQRRWLHTLRNFRRFCRHAYAARLDPAQLESHAGSVLGEHSGLVASLGTLLEEVRQLRDSLPFS